MGEDATASSKPRSVAPPSRSRVLPVVLGVILVASILANVWLLRAVKFHYTQEGEVRLDPAGLRTYEKERAASPPGNDRPVLAFFGDSRALMWGLPTSALPDYELRNVGVGNQTTAQLLLRFDADVPRLHPSVIVIEGGVNDLKVIAMLPHERATIIETCKANLAKLVEKSRATGARVVLTSVFAIGDVSIARKLFWSDEVATAIVEVNAYLKTLANEQVTWLDADPVLDDDRGKIKPEFQMDFLHLDEAGYAALSGQLTLLVRR